MASFFGIDESYSAAFFRNYSSSKGSSSGSSQNVLSQYASITNGSYYKLLKAYYEKNGTNSSAADNQEATSQLAVIKDDAKALSQSSEALYQTGKDSVFNKKAVTVTDPATGSETSGYEYDMDSIYKAVKSFADDYNSVLDSSGDAENTAILHSAKNMTQVTKANEKLLSGIGITIGSDNKLTIDEEIFKTSDVSTIKTLFSGAGSYAYTTAAKALNIQYAASSAISSGQSYNSSGNYSNLTTGTLYDSLF